MTRNRFAQLQRFAVGATPYQFTVSDNGRPAPTFYPPGVTSVPRNLAASVLPSQVTSLAPLPEQMPLEALAATRVFNPPFVPIPFAAREALGETPQVRITTGGEDKMTAIFVIGGIALLAVMLLGGKR